MKNEILQEQYEKVFEMLYKARYTKTHELITPMKVNHQLCAPQHGGSFALDMGIPIEERATHRNGDQHETSLNPVASTRSKRSGMIESHLSRLSRLSKATSRQSHPCKLEDQ
ncbi:hypothetical protein EV2_023720 [Malus domestica]